MPALIFMITYQINKVQFEVLYLYLVECFASLQIIILYLSMYRINIDMHTQIAYMYIQVIQSGMFLKIKLLLLLLLLLLLIN